MGGGYDESKSTGRRLSALSPLRRRHAVGSTTTSLWTTLFLVAMLLFALVTFHIHLILGEEHEAGVELSDLVYTKTVAKVQKLEEQGMNAIRHVPQDIKRMEDYWLHRPSSSGGYGGGNGDGSSSNTKGISRSDRSNRRPKRVVSEEEIQSKMVPHTLTCPHAAKMTFWEKPRRHDLEWVSPFEKVGPSVKYVTFEPDPGGWNNIRMQFEIILVFALATGRTFVLPPDQPMYLLNKGKGKENHHGFDDYFPFHEIGKRLPIITMDEFMKREGVTGHLTLNDSTTIVYPPGNKTIFNGAKKEDRNSMWEYLRKVAACPPWRPMRQYLVMPAAPGVNLCNDTNVTLGEQEECKARREISAATREPRFYDEYWQQQQVVHFISKPGLGYRLLQHFYTFLHFDDIHVDRLVKRFVRDYVHYMDIIFCKAGYIVNKLEEEAATLPVPGFSTFHTRRGELQYKEVKIPSKQILANVGHHIPKNQLVYIATDERNKSFFDDFKTRLPRLRFMDDYFKEAGLDKINPNFLGMIDQVVAARGDNFIGTWFSTFTGYITRMRGYYGKHDHTVWYGDKKHMNRQQIHEWPKFPFYMREWNVSWTNIEEN